MNGLDVRSSDENCPVEKAGTGTTTFVRSNTVIRVFKMLDVNGHVEPDPNTFVRDLCHVKHFKVGPILAHGKQLAFLGEVEAVIGHVENVGHVCVRAGYL